MARATPIQPSPRSGLTCILSTGRDQEDLMGRLVLALGASLALLLASCGGSDGGNGSGGEAPLEDCVDLTTEGDTFTIRLLGNQFMPSCFTASASQSLRLVNEDAGLHSF